jgi:hypothetical protein
MIVGRRAWNVVTLRLCLTNLLVCDFTGCVFWQFFTLTTSAKIRRSRITHRTSGLKLACVVRVDRPSHAMPADSLRLVWRNKICFQSHFLQFSITNFAMDGEKRVKCVQGRLPLWDLGIKFYHSKYTVSQYCELKWYRGWIWQSSLHGTRCCI